MFVLTRIRAHSETDGSLHLTLHPKDVKLVLERGWGQRHPLARGGFFERFVPVGFVMVSLVVNFEANDWTFC